MSEASGGSPVKYRFGEMTWREVRDAANAERVAVLPVATIEDHGHHLPIDTDVLLCTTVCERGAALIPEECVLVPPVIHGYSPHHMDFPGTLTIDGHTFIKYVLDITKSLAHHGFTRILIVNGHGSNTPFCEVIARLTVVETGGKALAIAVNHWGINTVRDLVGTIRESPPGGISHACELETSMYLAIKPELVDMSQAVAEMERYPTASIPAWTDLVAGRPAEASAIAWMPYWSTFSQTGVRGDATKATAEKGEQILTAAAEGLAELVKELRRLTIAPRVDHH
ncbi:MAG: creatininase family protein [Chloroflexia bacterium]|nr:creatininase family protein [Chloroflexia bacterium]MDQ3410959.1 creatininase family protein [Chloroflexota bacterium]